MNRKILTSAIVMMICLMIIVPINKSAVSQERTRDGWGIVTDQNDNPVEDGVEVKFYQLYGPNNERRKYYKSEWTSTHAEMKGYYAWDAPEGYYDIIVRENTIDEGGWIQTWLVPGQWPNVVRNIKYGIYSTSK
jgi:hypothetical protein